MGRMKRGLRKALKRQEYGKRNCRSGYIENYYGILI